MVKIAFILLFKVCTVSTAPLSGVPGWGFTPTNDAFIYNGVKVQTPGYLGSPQSIDGCHQEARFFSSRGEAKKYLRDNEAPEGVLIHAETGRQEQVVQKHISYFDVDFEAVKPE